MNQGAQRLVYFLGRKSDTLAQVNGSRVVINAYYHQFV